MKVEWKESYMDRNYKYTTNTYKGKVIGADSKGVVVACDDKSIRVAKINMFLKWYI